MNSYTKNVDKINKKNYMKKYFEIYDIFSKLSDIYQELNNAFLKDIKNFVRKNGLILDYGAGTGNLAIPLVKKGFRVVALDIEKYGLNLLKIKLKKISPIFSITIYNKDLFEIKFKENIFDCIVLKNVLYLLKNPLKYLKTFRKILKKGGIIIISGPEKNINVKNLVKTVEIELKKKNVYDKYKKEFEIFEYINKNYLMEKPHKLISGLKIKKILLNLGFKIIKESHQFYKGKNYYIVAKR